MPSGEEISKLNIYNYILNNKDLSEEERIKLAIKYQIFMEGTSLFVEMELSEKIVTPMIFHQDNQIYDNNDEEKSILNINFNEPLYNNFNDSIKKIRNIMNHLKIN